MSAPSLSKSRVLSALQCKKQLYLDVQDKELKKEGKPKLAKYSASSQQALDWGNQVGELARRFFPGGKLIQHDNELHLAVRETKTLLEDSLDVPLFEATFQHDGILVRADVFIKSSGGNRLVEVKASSAVKDHHLDDCAIQAWVIRNAGYPLDRVEVAHVDTSFVYQGDGNYNGLIRYADVTDAVCERLPQVPKWIENARKSLADGLPEISIGRHCRKPYECRFLDHCTPNTTYPITKLPNPSKLTYALLKEGIEDIGNIPEGRLTNPLQERVRRITVAGNTELDLGAAAFVRELPYPRYYLDFETVSPAIPVWPDTRPYETLPVQWSCHIEKSPGQSPGQMPHAEFLDFSKEPPMRALAEKLIKDLGTTGPILMYTNYEERVIKGLEARFSDLSAQLANLRARLVDLKPITKDNYYHPKMLGSWSLKAVLPTIASDMDYKLLDGIQEGNAASAAYIEAIHPNTSAKRRLELERELLRYCKFDTEAMVRLVRFFGEGP